MSPQFNLIVFKTKDVRLSVYSSHEGVMSSSSTVQLPLLHL